MAIFVDIPFVTTIKIIASTKKIGARLKFFFFQNINFPKKLRGFLIIINKIWYEKKIALPTLDPQTDTYRL